jgi:hypothetical protein
VIGGDLAETMPELGLLQVDDLAAMALRAAVLAHHSADLAFRGPVTLLKDYDSPSHREVRLSAQQDPTASLREGFAYAEACG